MSQKDYYKILDIDKKASKDEIKKAFYKLAAKYHPDKKGGDEAKFKEINEAYQTLSNDEKRKQYDTFGQTFPGGAGAGGAGPFGQGGGFGGFDFSGFSGSDFHNMEFDLGDIFGDIFGGGFGGGSRVKKGRDMSMEIEISFEEAVFGVEKNVLISKMSKCKTCKGSRAKPGTKMETCKKCSGSGKIKEVKRSIFGAIESIKTCDECHGSGETPKEKCETCRGAGVLNTKEDIKINIPAGIKNREVIKISEMGEAIADGKTGDLYVTVLVKPHKVWKREGNDLVITQNIKLTDALLGAKYKIESLDGIVELDIPKGVSPNEILKIKGKGVPNLHNKKERGDILVKVNIEIPKNLSKKVEKIIEDLKEEGI